MLREATLAALLEWIEAEAARSAGVLIVDDIQWADPSTIELLNRVIARRATRVLVLLASRSEFESPWSSIEAIELGPLAPTDLKGIAAALPAASRMAAADVERLARRSDGIPLYFEELLRLEEQPEPRARAAACEQRDRDPTGAPRSAARPDRRPGGRARPDPDARLHRAGSPPRSARRRRRCPGLRASPRPRGLADAGLLQRAASEPPIYHFRHHLLRELAYETQLKPARAQRHSRIADALRDRVAGAGSTDAGLLAQHLEQAGRLPEAVRP